MTDEDDFLIKRSIDNHYLFSSLSIEIKDLILSRLFLIEICSGIVLFQEGEIGSFFYIIKKGRFIKRCSKEKTDKVYCTGETFGELALIQRNMRSYKIECIEDGILICLDGYNYRDIVRKMNKRYLKERIYFLSFIPLFRLSRIQIQHLAASMIQCEYKDSQFIFKDGEISEFLLIIKEGTVSCVKEGKEIRRHNTKDYFGESSILFETEWKLSIKSIGITVFYYISKSILKDTLGSEFKSAILSSICRNAFLKSEILHYFIFDENFSKIFRLFSINFYKKNEIVINQKHHINSKIIILIEGNLINSKSGEVLCQTGTLFGESLLRVKEELNYDILAISDSIGLEASWSDILNCLDLENNKKKLLSLVKMIQHLKMILIFKSCSDKKLLEICHKIGKKKYSSDEVIITENSPGENFYLIYKGVVRVMKNNKYVREIEVGNVFGETSLLLNENHSATLIATSEKVCVYTLSKKNFLTVIDKKMQELMINKISLQDNFNTNLNDLFFLKSLGKGKFGSVSLVHNTKNLYAVKSVPRSIADKNRYLIKYFQTERRILLSIEHPFIITLVKTLKGNDHIFYLMEYIEEFKREDNLRNIYEIQFYIGILLITLDYLNNKSIVHRDIKPDNIMINHNGYLKMIDFGTAIIIKDLTNTLTGTPNYIAPEVILGKGYSFSADYWSIGIIAYELFFNFYPFGNEASDPMEVYKEVLRRELEFPSVSNHEEESFCVFVSSLLKKNVLDRACNIDILKKSKLFENFNINDLSDFSLRPPYVPGYSTHLENSLVNTKTKYSDKIQILFKNKYSFSKSSSFEEDYKTNVNYDLNWDSEF